MLSDTNTTNCSLYKEQNKIKRKTILHSKLNSFFDFTFQPSVTDIVCLSSSADVHSKKTESTGICNI